MARMMVEYPYGEEKLVVYVTNPDETWVNFLVGKDEDSEENRLSLRLDHLKEIVAKIEAEGFR